MDPEGDWMAVLEAAGAACPEPRAWAERLFCAVRPLLGASGVSEAVVGFGVVTHPPECTSMRVELALGHAEQLQQVREQSPFVGPAGLRTLYYPRRYVTKHTALTKHLDADARAFFSEYRARQGVEDCLGIMTHPVPGTSVFLYAGCSLEHSLDRARAARLVQLALHIEAGYRLRLHPERVQAILTPDGKILHLDGAPRALADLARRVKEIERVRTRRHRREPASVDVWQALVRGEASIVERIDGGRRCYFVVANAPAQRPFRSLSPGELDVLSHAARGLSAKLVGYALGIAESTVSARLATAAAKIGLATRTEIVRLAAMLTQDPRAGFGDAILSAAEREILGLLARGLSNGEIAEIRSRSVHTIANQVARLLRKTKSPSRRALVARASRA